MRVRYLRLLGLAVLLLTGRLAAAAEAPVDEARALARKIDRLIEKRWTDAKVEPARPADDAEFLRRVYLDLVGRIPTVAEAREFLHDQRPDRRARLVEQLLASPRHANHFANLWRALLIPEANNNFLVRLQQSSFEAWLKEQVAGNVGYDRMVRELLKAPVASLNAANAFASFNGPNTLAFYSAKEFKAENLAASTARIFLGASVECAQCHNHPFSNWKREQFWEFAAFFAGMRSQKTMDVLLPANEVRGERKITVPGTEKVVEARFLDGSEPTWKPNAAARATLAEWVTAPSNPYFARAAVNRLWASFLGTGLVEPVDEIVGAAEPSNPELLDLLAREFIKHKFDTKYLIRAITATRAYQLSSAATAAGATKGTSQDEPAPALFARMPLRGLTPEQLFDSLATATGYRDAGGTDNNILAVLTGSNRSARTDYLTKFANPAERPVEAQTSILQALTLMNGKVTAAATSVVGSETLAAVAESPFASTAEKVETLYLATLARRPSARESERAVRFIDEAGNRGGNGEALADFFWALLNTSEFKLNH